MTTSRLADLFVVLTGTSAAGPTVTLGWFRNKGRIYTGHMEIAFTSVAAHGILAGRTIYDDARTKVQVLTRGPTFRKFRRALKCRSGRQLRPAQRQQTRSALGEPRESLQALFDS